MPFTRPALAVIYNRMKADFESELKQSGWADQVNWVPRSLLLISLAVTAGGIHLLYGFLVQLSRELFFATAVELLDWHAQLLDRPRLPAVKAIGEVRFTGTDTTVIDAGTEIQTPDGTIYTTDAQVTITGGIADADITARVSGSAGNVEAETMELVSPIIGVDSVVTVLVQPNGGVDQETDEALVARLYQRTRNPPGSGNKGDYERWALEIPGVGRVWVKSAEEWEGAGTVGVIIATESLEIVDPAVKSNVEDNIENNRPISAVVSVVNPEPIDCYLHVSISPDTETLRTDITAKLNETFVVDSSPGGTILLSHLNKAISFTAINDFEITAIYKDGSSIGVADIPSLTLQLLRLDGSSMVYSELT